MPILHLQFSGQGKGPDGKTVNLPPALVLQLNGPIIQVTLGLADLVAQEWVKQGLQLPGAHTGAALIDTGASTSCVDDEVAQQLRLPVVDVVKTTSATHQDYPAKLYPVSVEIVGALIKGDIPRAMGANLQAQGLVMLIGRDFLHRCTLHYNGPNGQFTICI